MTGRGFIVRRGLRFLRGTSGSAMVEYAIVLPLFLLMVLGIVDFGRLGSDYVMVKKALERGVRIAAVRPALCPGVPQTHVRASVHPNVTPPKFGTSCSVGGICADPGAISCALDPATPAGAEIWNRIEAVMPSLVTAQDITVTYGFDENLGFLGGPYVPSVTLSLPEADFEFVTPLGDLATVFTGAADPNGAPNGTIAFPDMSVTLPGEDLNLGTNG
ncbi:TadE/TadG family type IV pilus assembly protein [Sulfitobacter sp. D35]|uniref:TadE/TadG family type IV pilus assembly protein n=1 Tax=Sulfitobacter sp. D35 TaxID=3083252 RepID=UPI002970029C|nr:TadE/TadG family type IV pilus assembly protein [Sulfitobacter sp. D35]MDW4499973.1 TadE/TadG family type IV pilus assembly protein [Sulfitobacter sp. D35]